MRAFILMLSLFLATSVAFAGGPGPGGEEVLHVRLPAGVNGLLVLQDAAGHVVREVGNVRAAAVMAVDMSGLAAGAYVLRIIGDDRGWSGRLVVDR